MKVKDIIDMLTKNYDENEELVVAWWDRNLFRFYAPDGEEQPISASFWEEVVSLSDNDHHSWDIINQRVDEMIQDYIQHPERAR